MGFLRYLWPNGLRLQYVLRVDMYFCVEERHHANSNGRVQLTVALASEEESDKIRGD